MASTDPAQPGYLTLTELVFNYALYGGVGYLAAGRLGAWAGAGLFTTVLIVAGVVALLRASRDQGPDPRPDA